MSDWYQIQNPYYTVQITTLGAEIKRMFAKNRLRELMWRPQDEMEKKIWNRTSPILFPVVGKLKDNAYILKGKTYQMSQHGFARDKNFNCLECDATSAEFMLKSSAETMSVYPFEFELRVKYELNERELLISYSVKNTDRADIYFSLGSHPAFALDKFENYEIRFEKKEKGFYQLSEGYVDWKNLKRLPENKIILTKELFKNDALIFKDLQSHYVDLVDNKKHEVIRIKNLDCPFLGIWAKDSIPFICIEPWHGVADEAGHDQNFERKRGIIKLEMGNTFNFSYSIELLMLEELE